MWTEVPDKQKNITPEEVRSGPYPQPNKSVLATVEAESADESKDGTRRVLVSSLNSPEWDEKFKWLQADGPVKVIAWKSLPDPYEQD